MRERKNTTYDLIEQLFADVARGALHKDALREVLEDSYDMRQISASQYDEYIRRIDEGPAS